MEKLWKPEIFNSTGGRRLLRSSVDGLILERIRIMISEVDDDGSVKRQPMNNLKYPILCTPYTVQIMPPDPLLACVALRDHQMHETTEPRNKRRRTTLFCVFHTPNGVALTWRNMAKAATSPQYWYSSVLEACMSAFQHRYSSVLLQVLRTSECSASIPESAITWYGI